VGLRGGGSLGVRLFMSHEVTGKRRVNCGKWDEMRGETNTVT